MKKLVLLGCALVVLLPEATQAQTYPVDRGSWIVGGSTGLISNSDDDDERATSVFLNPSAQFFVLPGLAAGGTISLNYTSQDDFSVTNIGVGPALSYYFGRGTRNVHPFISTSLTYSRLRFNGADSRFRDLENTRTSVTFDVAGGVVLMVAKNVGVSGEVFYQEESINLDSGNEFTQDTDIDTDAFGFRIGVRIFAF